jgi:hypothetical protein
VLMERRTLLVTRFLGFLIRRQNEAVRQRLLRVAVTASSIKRECIHRTLIIRVQAIVGTGGHFLIRLRPQNEWDGQRDRGPEDGTIVKGL